MLTPEQLSTLDKDALIQIVLEQSSVITQQQTRLSELEARIRALEARLSQNSNNSSKPPSQDSPFAPTIKPPKNGRKSGGQPGHKGQGLSKVQTPDHTIVHTPAVCQSCGYDLAEQPGTAAGSWQVFELPADLTLEVTEHQRQSKCCPWCQHENIASLLPWLSQSTPCQYGPRCRALGVYLMQQQHLPFQRTQDLFEDLFGSAPSEGTLWNWHKQAYESLAPVEAAKQPLLRSW